MTLGLEVLTRHLVGGLVVGLAYDTERNITSINRNTLEPWGVSPDDAFKAAKDNLWEKTDPSRLIGQEGVYCGRWADSYDSSRILLTELIYRLSLDGDPVAFVPNRDQLWVTGTDNLAGLAAILKGGRRVTLSKVTHYRPSSTLLWMVRGRYTSPKIGHFETCCSLSRGAGTLSTIPINKSF